jgi:hypothetical protein
MMLFPTFRNILEMVQHDKLDGQFLLCNAAVESSSYFVVGLDGMRR